jgi:hypothetical protein
LLRPLADFTLQTGAADACGTEKQFCCPAPRVELLLLNPMDDAARQRWARVTAGVERLERESLERAAAATPGQNIESALALSSLVLRSQSDFSRPLPVSLVALWRARRQGA